MKERRKEGLRSRQERIANEVLMYFRSQKKLQGEVSLSDSIETDKEGNALQLMDVVGVDDTMLDDIHDRDSALRAQVQEAAQSHGVETLLISDGATAELGETALKIYPPLGSGGSNEEGLSVLGTAGTFDVLVTGDMNDKVEERLVKYGNLPQTELLVAGHHGSKYASSEVLLQAVQPKLAVISVGYNTYGHPAEDTLSRLARQGCDIYRTDWSGTVTITAE